MESPGNSADSARGTSPVQIEAAMVSVRHTLMEEQEADSNR